MGQTRGTMECGADAERDFSMRSIDLDVLRSKLKISASLTTRHGHGMGSKAKEDMRKADEREMEESENVVMS